jgi:hypothetical protein
MEFDTTDTLYTSTAKLSCAISELEVDYDIEIYCAVLLQLKILAVIRRVLFGCYLFS